jgi:hypothetical protein
MSASEIENSPLYGYDPSFRFVEIKGLHRTGQTHYRVDHKLEITVDTLLQLRVVQFRPPFLEPHSNSLCRFTH